MGKEYGHGCEPAKHTTGCILKDSRSNIKDDNLLLETGHGCGPAKHTTGACSKTQESTLKMTICFKKHYFYFVFHTKHIP